MRTVVANDFRLRCAAFEPRNPTFVSLCNPGQSINRVELLRDSLGKHLDSRSGKLAVRYQKFGRLSKCFVPFRQFLEALVDGHLRSS
jgi:hypothetical protein